MPLPRAASRKYPWAEPHCYTRKHTRASRPGAKPALAAVVEEVTPAMGGATGANVSEGRQSLTDIEGGTRVPGAPLRATALWATFYLHCILGAPATRHTIVRQRGPLRENTAPTRRGARAGPVHADHNEHGAEARGHTPRGRARGTPGGCSDGDTAPSGTATWRAVSARAEGDGAESAQLQPGGGGTHALRRARWVPVRPGATGDEGERAARRGGPW